MKIDVLTLFPEMFEPLCHSIIGRAMRGGKFQLNTVNIRDFSANKHKKTDDYPFGGGAGMVMTCQPIVDAVNAVDEGHRARRIFMSPRGKVLDQRTVVRLAAEENLLILCGHYEGVDQRAIDLTMDEEISIGDYVLTGGELPAMVLCDCILRYVPEVLGSDASTEEESFSRGLLEYPQYTRPEVYNGIAVPPVLLSGNHAEIARWRYEQQLLATKQRRPDLLGE